MKNILNKINYFLAVAVSFSLVGCANYFEPMKTSPATLGTETYMSYDLRSLPKPKEKIVTAVYKFRDQTGQYKASSTGFCRAHTDFACSSLINQSKSINFDAPI